ncbi:MAG: hypothetical protein U9P73_01200 [Candidatus Cloacimonadota bacterium]|nr:hypothetical protein [Candidatus Cloacimonadota bacterium]
MNKKELKNELSKYLVSKTIMFEKGKGFISTAILESQNIVWQEEGKRSQWSHIGFVGTDGKFYESTVKFGWKKILYGIRVSKPKKILKEIIKHDDRIGFQFEFENISDEDWIGITAKGKELKRKKVAYGGVELIGTLITILRWKLTRNPDKRKRIMREHNPFDKSKSMYCIAFVADCIEKANVDYVNVEHSVSTVDHGWFTKLKHENKKIKLEY